MAAKSGVGTAETVRKWVRQAEIDADARRGVSSQDGAELRKLRAENRKLRRPLMRSLGSGRFLRGRARPATQDLVRLIAEHAGRATVDGLRRSALCRSITARRSPPAPTTTRATAKPADRRCTMKN
ncbi:MAG: hypothetical protein WAK86_12485 [Pseudonocardiaceae bacterium]